VQLDPQLETQIDARAIRLSMWAGDCGHTGLRVVPEFRFVTTGKWRIYIVDGALPLLCSFR
jgi:hypothetical protein